MFIVYSCRNIVEYFVIVVYVIKVFLFQGSTVQRQASCKERAKEFPTYKDNDFLEEKCQLYLSEDSMQRLIELLMADTEFLAGLHLMDYSLLVGIHLLDQPSNANDDHTEGDADADEADDGDSSVPDNESTGSNDFSQPTPPDSPVPFSGAFAPFTISSSNIDLDDDFYAVPSRPDAPERAIYFIGLVDILTYYGVKKKTAAAAKTVKYGPEAEISSVKPQQYAKRLVDFVVKAVNCEQKTVAVSTIAF
ncbi:unnamed protein product [Soboliphyme baturini]|uniref:PIPK domain-containing protein n=1 Tax=Soboliphyme baturini TaxID=241478 RepID=A0A3P8BZS0_9BILA|nr:unnamed protein product [Soboliphyme baturini]